MKPAGVNSASGIPWFAERSAGDGAIILRAMTTADAASDRALFDEDRRAQFAPLGLDETMLIRLLNQQFVAQQVGYRNAFPGAEEYVIERAGETIGRLTTSLTGQGETTALHVIAIVVSASARGRGIGTTVMNGLERSARAKGATRLTLSVLRGNDGARRFYERLGFGAAADDDTRSHLAMVKLIDSGV